MDFFGRIAPDLDTHYPNSPAADGIVGEPRRVRVAMPSRLAEYVTASSVIAGKEVVQHSVDRRNALAGNPASNGSNSSPTPPQDNATPPVKAGGNVVQISDGPALKAKKKEMRLHKVFNFVLFNYDGEEQLRRMNGLCNQDLQHDDQWWFDYCDREMS